MSISSPIKVVTDNLVFHYDAGSKRSYIGAPTSNVFYTPTPDASLNVGFAVNGTGTFKRVLEGRYGGYDIQSTDVVYRYDLGGTGCHYHGNDYNIPSGYYVTFAFDYYISPGAGSYPVTNYLANIENGGNGIGASVADYDSTTGVWKRAVMSPNTTSNGSGFSRFLLYPGACGSSTLATSGYILYKNPQAELRPFSSAYIPTGASSTGSRSSTNSLIDMMGNCTLDLTNATYDSSGNISFNGSSGRITSTTSLFNKKNTEEITVACWIKPARNAGQYQIIAENRSSDTSLYNWILYQHMDNGAISFHGSAQNKSTYVPTVNAWIYVVNTVTTGGVSTLYINGSSVYTVSGYTYNNTAPSLLCIGGDGNGAECFQGNIDTVSIYNRALSAIEIVQNYNASKGRFGLL